MLRIASLSDLRNQDKFEQLTISVNHEDEEELNIELEDVVPGAIMVKRVKVQSLLEGHLQAGDYVLTVNDRMFKSREELFRFAQKQDPTLRISVARPKAESKRGVAATPPILPTTTPNANAVKSMQTSSRTSPSSKSVNNRSESEGQKSPASSKMLEIGTSSSCGFKTLISFHGDIIKRDRQYFVFQISTTTSRRPLGLAITTVPSDKATVMVSSLEPNSICANVMKVGDRIISINQTKITDVGSCQKLILESFGYFVVLVERSPQAVLPDYGFKASNAIQTKIRYFFNAEASSSSSNCVASKTGPVSTKGSESTASNKSPIAADDCFGTPPLNIPLQSSYTTPSQGDPEHALGNPLGNYETAPSDVQTILNKQIPLLFLAFSTWNPDRSFSARNAPRAKDKLKIEKDVHEQHIASDVRADQQLKQCPKR